MYRNAHRNPYLSLLVVDSDPVASVQLSEFAKNTSDVLDVTGTFDSMELDTSIHTDAGGESMAKLNLLLCTDQSVDGIICSQEIYELYRDEDIFESWGLLLQKQDDLLTANRITDTALDLSNSQFWNTEYVLYEPVYLCIKKNSARTENASRLAEYLLQS